MVREVLVPEWNAQNEVVIPLPNGGTLRSGLDPDTGMQGQYVRICDENGDEVIYWHNDEWETDPILVMGAIFNAASTSIKHLLKELGKTEVVNGYWE